MQKQFNQYVEDQINTWYESEDIETIRAVLEFQTNQTVNVPTNSETVEIIDNKLVQSIEFLVESLAETNVRVMIFQSILDEITNLTHIRDWVHLRK